MEGSDAAEVPRVLEAAIAAIATCLPRDQHNDATHKLARLTAQQASPLAAQTHALAQLAQQTAEQAAGAANKQRMTQRLALLRVLSESGVEVEHIDDGASFEELLALVGTAIVRHNAAVRKGLASLRHAVRDKEAAHAAELEQLGRWVGRLGKLVAGSEAELGGGGVQGVVVTVGKELEQTLELVDGDNAQSLRRRVRAALERRGSPQGEAGTLSAEDARALNHLPLDIHDKARAVLDKGGKLPSSVPTEGAGVQTNCRLALGMVEALAAQAEALQHEVEALNQSFALANNQHEKARVQGTGESGKREGGDGGEFGHGGQVGPGDLPPIVLERPPPSIGGMPKTPEVEGALGLLVSLAKQLEHEQIAKGRAELAPSARQAKNRLQDLDVAPLIQRLQAAGAKSHLPDTPQPAPPLVLHAMVHSLADMHAALKMEMEQSQAVARELLALVQSHFPEAFQEPLAVSMAALFHAVSTVLESAVARQQKQGDESGEDLAEFERDLEELERTYEAEIQQWRMQTHLVIEMTSSVLASTPPPKETSSLAMRHTLQTNVTVLCSEFMDKVSRLENIHASIMDTVNQVEELLNEKEVVLGDVGEMLGVFLGKNIGSRLVQLGHGVVELEFADQWKIFKDTVGELVAGSGGANTLNPRRKSLPPRQASMPSRRSSAARQAAVPAAQGRRASHPAGASRGRGSNSHQHQAVRGPGRGAARGRGAAGGRGQRA